MSDWDDWCNKIVTDIMLYNNECIEEKLKELIIKGCDCGNNDVTKFTLVYIEQDFAYIQCDVCERHIYPKKELITTSLFEKWVKEASYNTSW